VRACVHACTCVCASRFYVFMQLCSIEINTEHLVLTVYQCLNS